MLKNTRYACMLLSVLMLPIMMSCGTFSSDEAGDRTASVTVMIDVQTLPQAQLQAQKKFLGTVIDITSITVDVLYGKTSIISGQQLTYGDGVWSGTLENLPIGPSLTFVGHAYNSSAVEIFNGTTLKKMTGAADSVTILMAPVDDGVAPLFPRITRIVVPAQIASSSTVTVGISVEASSGETLEYWMFADPAGGSFDPYYGSITLVGTTGTIVLNYTAPSTTGTFSNSIALINSQGNSVETSFSTIVSGTASASLVMSFSPMIMFLDAKRSGTDAIFFATVTSQDIFGLTYSWGFDGGLDFADNTVNPATLQGYNETVSGTLTLTVSDGTGGTSTVSYNIEPGLLPDNVTQYQLIFSEYVEGSSFNKALEIWNTSSEAVDLQACSIRIYYNGNTTPQDTIALYSILPAQSTFVICNQSAGAALAPYCDAKSSSLNFNGDDAVELVCNNTTIDVFGRIGEDPGLGWGSTYAHTLQRACTVTAGDTNGFDAFDPAVEWSFLDIDTFDGLGARGCPL